MLEKLHIYVAAAVPDVIKTRRETNVLNSADIPTNESSQVLLTSVAIPLAP